MLRRLAVIGIALFVWSAAYCPGQICQTSHQSDLFCLIPSAFRTTASPFSAFYTPFGTELSQLPIAKPAGLVLRIENGHIGQSSETLGPVFADRAETIGKNSLFLGGTFQYFQFNTIDGNQLGSLPILLSFPATNPTFFTATVNRFDIKTAQYAFLAAYGVTKHLDVSATIPFERVAMSVAVLNGTEYSQGFAPLSFKEYVPGSSSGIGDVLLGAKYAFLDRAKVAVAGAVDVRLPSGDELNFLGSGTPGIRPSVAMSLHGHVSPHVNLGYQWNGNSILNTDQTGQKQQLPPNLFYVVGMDAAVNRRLTVVADLVGHHFYNAPRLTGPQSVSVVGTTQTSVNHYISSYTQNDLSVGIKGQMFSHLIFTGNALIKLDSAGLRSTVAPLFGISYSK